MIKYIHAVTQANECYSPPDPDDYLPKLDYNWELVSVQKEGFTYIFFWKACYGDETFLEEILGQ